MKNWFFVLIGMEVLSESVVRAGVSKVKNTLECELQVATNGNAGVHRGLSPERVIRDGSAGFFGG